MESKSQLVQTTTKDDLILSGIYLEGSKEKEAIIFIHGFTSDFYTHKFNHVLADKVNLNGNAVVLAQNRGTGICTEVLKSNRSDSEYLGSYYEKLEEAHLDISAWIEFLKNEGYSKFILAGHSLGTIKSVRYLFEGQHKALISKLILFAPFDKNGYIERKTKGEWHEHLKVAEQKIKDGKELEIIPDTFDDFPMTFRTYYSWYREYDLNSIWDFYKSEYISPILKQISIPVKVIVGSNDDDFYTKGLGGSLEKSVQYLKNNIFDLEIDIINGANHTYVGLENDLADSVLNFLN